MALLIDTWIVPALLALLLLAALGLSAYIAGIDLDSNAARDVQANAILVSFCAPFVAVLLIEIFAVARSGTSFGRAIMGIRVVRMADGAPPGLTASLSRFLTGATLSLFACVGGIYVPTLTANFDRTGQNRAWHDRASGTRVVVSRS
jgi:uncharacterized RDD family membrane protein YckC